MSRISAALVCLALLIAFAAPAQADDFRCGQRLVSVGETTGEVALKCGPPTAADRRVETGRARGGGCRSTVIDTWTYDRGPTSFIRILTFVDGKLERVE